MTDITPHVDIAHRLARVGDEFRVPIVITNTVHQFLTDGAKKYCRLMDSIKLHGVNDPLTLYTYDVWNTAASRRLSMVSTSFDLVLLLSIQCCNC